MPPVIGSVQNVVDATLPSTFGSLDVRITDLGDDNVSTVQHYTGADNVNQGLPAALRGAVRVRVIEGFSSEAAPGVTMFGLTMDEGAAVLGEADGLRRRIVARQRPPLHPGPPAAGRQVRALDPQPAPLGAGHARRKPRMRRMPRKPDRRQRSRHQPELDGRRRPRRAELRQAGRRAAGVPMGGRTGRRGHGAGVSHRQVRHVPQRHPERQQAADVLHRRAHRHDDRDDVGIPHPVPQLVEHAHPGLLRPRSPHLGVVVRFDLLPRQRWRWKWTGSR